MGSTKPDVGRTTDGADLCTDERFMRDLVARLKTTRGWEQGSRMAPWRSTKTMCERYHEHEDGRLCCKVKEQE